MLEQSSELSDMDNGVSIQTFEQFEKRFEDIIKHIDEGFSGVHKRQDSANHATAKNAAAIVDLQQSVLMLHTKADANRTNIDRINKNGCEASPCQGESDLSPPAAKRPLIAWRDRRVKVVSIGVSGFAVVYVLLVALQKLFELVHHLVDAAPGK